LFNNEKKNVNLKYLNDFNNVKDNNKEKLNLIKNKEINFCIEGLNKIKLNKNKNNYVLIKNIIFNKGEYLKKIVNLDKNEFNLLNGLFKKFYILNRKKNTYLHSIITKKTMLTHIHYNSIFN